MRTEMVAAGIIVKRNGKEAQMTRYLDGPLLTRSRQGKTERLVRHKPTLNRAITISNTEHFLPK